MKLLCTALAAAFAFSTAQAQTAINTHPVWDLTPLYATEADWEKARQQLLADIPRIAKLQGTLGRSAQQLRAALDQLSDVTLRYQRLAVFANMQQSTDNRSPAFQERATLVAQLGGQLASSAAFVEPELQKLGAAKVNGFVKREPGLQKHSERLRSALRLAPHTLGAEAEAAIAALAPTRGQATAQARTLLVNADMKWPTLTIDGKPQEINDTSYGAFRQHPDRAVREQVFKAFFGALGQYQNTFGVTLANTVQDGTTMARLRKYPSAVAAAVDPEEVPEAVYRQLVTQVRAGLPTLHRYFKLRQRMLGLPDLGYHDIYPALVPASKASYSLEDAARLTYAATTPLGPEYQQKLQTALSGRWMHALPAPGKSGGAYQDGVWGVHPYVFLNHQDDFESVSTFAHEWGHGIHTAMANAAQPFEKANYALFVAEIASTANELLLSQHMLKESKTKEERLYQLGYALERLRGTFFRQAMFGEFELRTHDAAAKGEALSGVRFTKLYCELLKEYHGEAQGVMKIDPVVCNEWAFIPHFYRPFYVYQYATSITAAQALVEPLLAGDLKARDTYLQLLKTGSSVPPYEALKRAGVDMASPAPYLAVVHRMNRLMDEMETLLAAR